MSAPSSPVAAAPRRELRLSGGGALLAALALVVTPATVFLAPLLGVEWPSGAAAFDPVTNASWVFGAVTGLPEVAQAVGLALLVVGVRQALPPGIARDLGALAGAIWVTGIALHATSVFVKNTPAQTASWEGITDDVVIRAAIGAGATVVQWGFLALAVLAGFAWVLGFLVAGRPTGLVATVPVIVALVVAGLAVILVLLGIVPPAATFAQIVVLLLLALPLLLRARRLRAERY